MEKTPIPAVAVFGAVHSPHSYRDASGKPAEVAPTPALGAHVFEEQDGDLVHLIDGRERARVPPAGFDDYLKCWPECRPVIDAIRGQAGDTDGEPTTRRRK
jgi:hypothetical protein